MVLLFPRLQCPVPPSASTRRHTGSPRQGQSTCDSWLVLSPAGVLHTVGPQKAFGMDRCHTLSRKLMAYPAPRNDQSALPLTTLPAFLPDLCLVCRHRLRLSPRLWSPPSHTPCTTRFRIYARDPVLLPQPENVQHLQDIARDVSHLHFQLNTESRDPTAGFPSS